MDTTVSSKHEVYKGHIIFLEIHHDECAENPLENCDAMGRIVSFNSRHVNFQHPDEIENDPDRVMLSYYEHSLCRWSVAGTMGSHNCHHWGWDGVSVAGVWYPDKYLREDAAAQGLKPGSDERRKQMETWAQQACDEYTKWCNGEVYCVSVQAYPAKYEGEYPYDDLEDYRFNEDAVYDESCCGFLGLDYAEDEGLDWMASAKKAVDKVAVPEEAART